jgi:serine protease AprX
VAGSRTMMRTAVALTAGLVIMPLPLFTASAGASGATVDVIVQAGSTESSALAVARAGGHVVVPLALVGGVEAELSSAGLAQLGSYPAILVTPNVTVHPTGDGFGGGSPAPQLTAMGVEGVRSPAAGDGVGVAVIDTGVDPVPGLSRVVRGVDLSGEGDGVDHYGHGTFMAGLIAGKSSGVAPGATIVSVKVAGADGATTLAKVIGGIGWVVTHQSQFNLRVLNISFGAVLPVPTASNPLDAAVEAAWASGIVVVTASGNEGAARVTSPGDDPWVITAGAAAPNQPGAAFWSGRSSTKPDLLAPGVSVLSLRAPGSTIDRTNPGARVGDGYFRGTGTSMSSALTAGAAALLVHDHPTATPDDVKGALIAGTRASGRQEAQASANVTVQRSPGQDGKSSGQQGPDTAQANQPDQGGGSGRGDSGDGGDLGGASAAPRMIDVARADRAQPSPTWWQHHPIAFDGLGIGLTAMPWTSVSWTSVSWTSVSWTSVSWTSVSWTSVSWTSVSWTSVSWTSVSWTSVSWTSLGWW